MKNRAEVHKRSDWQRKSNCIHGCGSDIPEGRIPLPYKNRLCIRTPPQGQYGRGRLRRSHRMIEEATEILRKTGRKVRTTTGKRVCWHCFMEALWSKVE